MDIGRPWGSLRLMTRTHQVHCSDSPVDHIAERVLLDDLGIAVGVDFLEPIADVEAPSEGPGRALEKPKALSAAKPTQQGPSHSIRSFVSLGTRWDEGAELYMRPKAGPKPIRISARQPRHKLIPD